ncbi:MAG: hypothetical protein GX221_00970 [Candidatus Riflebacteria bacterium]|nr:hypothetical protein [Candidatus Riflebacteria bacterium]
MRHQKSLRKFGRQSNQRTALLRSLTTSLVKYEQIETSLYKAKDLSRVIEKAVTLAKKYNAMTDSDPQRLAGMKRMKLAEIERYFHNPADREIVGRDNIKRYLENELSEEQAEALKKFMKEPDKNPKPDFVLDYIPATASRTIKVQDKEIKKERTNAVRILRVEGTVRKLVNKIAPRFADVPGGYTQIFQTRNRRGDNAKLAVIRFTK